MYADLQLLSRADMFVGTLLSTISQLVLQALTGKRGTLPPCISVDGVDVEEAIQDDEERETDLLQCHRSPQGCLEAKDEAEEDAEVEEEEVQGAEEA